MRTVRIGAGQGFYGDSLLPVLDVARYGNVKYISFDTLAELTLAILEKGRKKDPTQGYTKDVVPMMRNLLPIAKERGIKLITNAGGINPQGAAKAVAQVAKELGLKAKIACVTGDDIYDRLDSLAAQGVTFADKESGQALGDIRDRVLFASVYLGAQAVADALRTGADETLRLSDLTLPHAFVRVLLAEDDEDLRVMTARMLKAEGHSVTEAADGLEAERLLAGGGFDALVSDIMMPGRTGTELAAAARAMGATPIGKDQ